MLIFSLLLNMQSHPTWVRGLKQGLRHLLQSHRESHPTWVRGLKHGERICLDQRFVSHPTWVRGLKQDALYHLFARLWVAPYMGAWIETKMTHSV